MRKIVLVLIVICLCVSSAYYSSYSAEAARRPGRFTHPDSPDEAPDTDCGDNIIGFIALGILGGTFCFFAWCWRIFKSALAFIFRPVKRLLGIPDKLKTQPVIITAPVMQLKPMKQYYKLDPEFDGEGIKALIANLYVQMQNARQNKDISPLRPYMTDEFYSQIDGQLDAFRKQNKTAYSENIAVLNVTLKGWRQAAGMDYITVGLNSRVISYVLDDVSGKLLSGDRTREKFMEYEIDLSRKRGVITAPKSEIIQSHTCPNCGAPVKLNNSAKCEYCGSVINQVNTDWAICAVRGISSVISG